MKNTTRFNWAIATLSIICALAGPAFGQEIEPKGPNPTGALLRSAFVPGLGQYYNGKYIKGTIIALGESYLIYGIYENWRASNRYEKNFKSASDPAIKSREFDKFEDAIDRRNLRMWILAAAVFYSMFDAYVDAHLADFNQRDKSYEVFVAPRDDGLQLVLTLDIK
jgi:hypothetical protein